MFSSGLRQKRAWLNTDLTQSRWTTRENLVAATLVAMKQKRQENKPELPRIIHSDQLPLPTAKSGLEIVIDQKRDFFVICLKKIKFLLQQAHGLSGLLEG